MPFEAFEVSLKVVELLRRPIARLKAQDPDLARQLKRASSSTALNLAEGAGREGRDRRQHYRIARGSARETQAALRVAAVAVAVGVEVGVAAFRSCGRSTATSSPQLQNTRPIYPFAKPGTPIISTKGTSDSRNFRPSTANPYQHHTAW